tara:strand:+ start:1227 stop:2117 length:891 start_codon:yes stop_codon:yes gene_type:complete
MICVYADLKTHRCRAMDWEGLKTFAIVCRSGTMSAAARELGVNQTTIARRIARLEQTTGFPVLRRDGGVLRPTLRAEKLRSTADAMALQIGDLIGNDDAMAPNRAAPDISGVVRVTGVDAVLENCIAPRLGDLTGKHPALCIELIGGNRNLSLPQRESDIALRLARPQTGAFHIRKLGMLEYGVYCADGIADPAVAPWIDLDDVFADKPEQLWLGANFPNRNAVGRANRGAIMAAMAVSAKACALLPRCVGDTFTGLVHCPDYVPTNRELWLLTHQDMRHVPRVQVVVDWLVKKLV